MAVIERDIVLMGKDANGDTTIDLPLTRLSNIEDSAEVKAAPEAGDYLVLVDGSDRGQMKKTPAQSLKAACITVNLTAAGWSGDGPYTQSVAANGVTEANAVIPAPAPASWTAAAKAGVYCSAQAANSLTFTCQKKPTETLAYSVMIQEVG